MEPTEYEKKKNYLMLYGQLDKRITETDEEIKTLKLNVMCPSVSYDDMPKGGGQSDLSGYAARLDKLQSRRESLKLRRMLVRRGIRSKVAMLEDEREQDVLIFRYLNFMSWTDIEARLKPEPKYSREVYRIHKSAINHLVL